MLPDDKPQYDGYGLGKLILTKPTGNRNSNVFTFPRRLKEVTPEGSSEYPTHKCLDILELHGQSNKGETPNETNIALFVKITGEKEGTTEKGEYQIELSFDPATARQVARYLVELADITNKFQY